MTLLKYFASCFVAQILLLIASVALLEITGFLVFWWFLLYAYVLPANKIISLLGTTVQDRDAMSLLSSFVMITFYSLIFTGILLFRKRNQGAMSGS